MVTICSTTVYGCRLPENSKKINVTLFQYRFIQSRAYTKIDARSIVKKKNYILQSCTRRSPSAQSFI
jgi:hypothetical protein